MSKYDNMIRSYIKCSVILVFFSAVADATMIAVPPL